MLGLLKTIGKRVIKELVMDEVKKPEIPKEISKPNMQTLVEEIEKDIASLRTEENQIWHRKLEAMKQTTKDKKLRKQLQRKREIFLQRRDAARVWLQQYDVPQSYYQSRWGYHVLSHEDFKKLKFIRKHMFQELYRLGQYMRWAEKDPSNRVRMKKIFSYNSELEKIVCTGKYETCKTKPPKLGTLFTRISNNYPSAEKQTNQILGPVYYDSNLDRYLYIYCGDVIRDYEVSKKPFISPSNVVFPLTLISKIDQLYKECKAVALGLCVK